MAIIFIDTNIVIEYIKEPITSSLVSYIDSFDIVYNIDLYTLNKKDFRYINQINLI